MRLGEVRWEGQGRRGPGPYPEKWGFTGNILTKCHTRLSHRAASSSRRAWGGRLQRGLRLHGRTRRLDAPASEGRSGELAASGAAETDPCA